MRMLYTRNLVVLSINAIKCISRKNAIDNAIMYVLSGYAI